MAVNRRATPRRRSPQSAKAPASREPAEGPVLVSDVVTSLLRSVVAARSAMDATSAELASAYWADPILRTLPLPAFGIPEVKVRLRFAISDIARAPARRGAAPPSPEMRIIVDLASLEKVPEHLISEIELRLTPQAMIAAEAEAEEKTRARR